MDDAARVRCRQGVGNLRAVEQGFVHRPRAFLEHAGQRLTLDQLHHQVVRAHIVERADVRMVQGRDGAGFAGESCAEAFLAHLDRHGAVQPGVAGAEDAAHAARAEECLDLVRTQASDRDRSAAASSRARRGAPRGSRAGVARKPAADSGCSSSDCTSACSAASPAHAAASAAARSCSGRAIIS